MPLHIRGLVVRGPVGRTHFSARRSWGVADQIVDHITSGIAQDHDCLTLGILVAFMLGKLQVASIKVEKKLGTRDSHARFSSAFFAKRIDWLLQPHCNAHYPQVWIYSLLMK